ncbi:MAG: hypothetical protein AB1626_03620 [Candidatus Micrarchaeota archaeon]
MYTSIQINPNTRERLARLKAQRETYDELLNALLDLVPEGDEEGKYSPEFRASLLRGLADIRRGRTHSLEDVRKELGLS